VILLPQIKVSTGKDNQNINVPAGITLLDALKSHGYYPESPCNGKGICGKCRVLIRNPLPYTTEEKAHLSQVEINNGIHLSCMVKVHEDLEVSLNSGDRKASIVTETSFSETGGNPVVKKSFVNLPVPSINDQRSDDIRLFASDIQNHQDLHNGFKSYSLSLLRELPGILRKNDFNVTLIEIAGNITGVESGNTASKNFGVAIDIGTTTLAAYLYDLNERKPVSVASRLNPQRKFGADVISRIEYSLKSSENRSEISLVIRNAVNDLIHQLVTDAGIQNTDVYAVTLAGNTTMLHLLLELPAVNIASAPFIPVLQSGLLVNPKDLELDINPYGRVFALPSVSAYIGADTTAAVLSTEMHRQTDFSLLIDIGTNGEIVIGNSSFLYACSTAAGPAFEGANISCGIGSIEGAINGVTVTDSGIMKINTIGGYKPVGICGSGLIDAVACMLKTGVMDETGRILDIEEMDDNVKEIYGDRIIEINDQAAFLLVPAGDTGHNENIYITQKDIRELQNAKAAIAAGISILISEAHLDVEDIKNVYLSGGFGNYINIDSAAAIGLLPGELSGRTKPVGNAAGAGAIVTLLSEEKLSEICAIAKQVKYVELSARLDFSYLFADNMFFGTDI